MRKSLFRPASWRPASLDDHREDVQRLQRRNLLRGGLSLGALTMLTGCDASNETAVGKALRAISDFNDGAQAALFNPDKLAPEFPKSQVLKPPRFNAYYDIEEVKPVDGKSWQLELSGMIQDKKPWTQQQLAALPQREMVIRHICVEGWDYIGQWSGPLLRSLPGSAWAPT